MVKSPPANAGDMGSIPGSGRSLGVGNGKLFQYSCLRNSKDRGAREATVQGIAKSQTRLKHINTRVVHNFIYEFEQHSLVTMKHPLGL